MKFMPRASTISGGGEFLFGVKKSLAGRRDAVLKGSGRTTMRHIIWSGIGLGNISRGYLLVMILEHVYWSGKGNYCIKATLSYCIPNSIFWWNTRCLPLASEHPPGFLSKGMNIKVRRKTDAATFTCGCWGRRLVGGQLHDLVRGVGGHNRVQLNIL